MLCIEYNKKEKLKVVEKPIPKIERDEALLKVEACGICGSDLIKIKNNLVEEGTVLGHEIVGTIVEVGSPTKKDFLNKKAVVAHHVPCLSCHFCKHGNFSMCSQFKNTNIKPGGFSEYIKISKEHLEQATFIIPKCTVSENELALTEPLACCMRAVNRAQVSASNIVLVCGLGSIGIMIGKLCEQKGATVIGLDLIQERINLAKNMSAITNGFIASSPELKSFILRKTEGRGVDTVFLASGSTKSLEDTLNLIRPGGTILVFSSIPKEIGFYNNEIYYRELTIMGSYSPSPLDLREAHQQILTEKIKLGPLITDVVSLKDLPKEINKCFENKSLKMIARVS